jgi:hypothetical protein
MHVPFFPLIRDGDIGVGGLAQELQTAHASQRDEG